MELGLKGKSALITGASYGIGKAIKDSLEDEGVICISWSRSEGLDLDNGLPLGEFMKIKDVDILINNFGGGGTWKPEDFRIVMDRNYSLTQILTREFINHNRDYGRVITISSVYGKEKGNSPEFTAAKAAQIAFMKTLAGNYRNITFNTIAPGMIDTGKFTKYQLDRNIVGQPEDVAGIVTFLCSDLAKHINGSCITVDGGFSHSF